MNPTTQAISTILVRDLNKVIAELNLFTHESNIWVVDGTISNSAGNLALHISGAISHFVGAVLGNDGYIRNRESEFTVKNLSKEEVLGKVRDAAATASRVLPSISEDELDLPFPEKIGNRELTIRFFLIHFVGHVNYHLGQINYHRRLIDNQHEKG